MLTDKNIRDAKPQERPYKLADGAGMYLLIRPDGSRYWRLKFRFGGREKLLALGTYPAVTLKEARKRRDDAKSALRDGRDPGAEKQATKRAAKIAGANTFEAAAREWHSKARNTWDPRHADRVWTSLENNLLPDLGSRPIAAIDAPELLAVLRKIESRGAHETRMRAQQRAGAVFLVRRCHRPRPTRSFCRSCGARLPRPESRISPLSAKGSARAARAR